MAATGVEVELKFSPASDTTLRALAARAEFPGWRIVDRVIENQQNTYYDTGTARLEAAGASLRRRLLATGLEWTFKQGPGPGRDGVARRQEINSRLSLDQTRDELPACPAISRARSLVGGERLEPLFSLRTLRTQVELTRADGTRLALALDRVGLEGDRHAPPYRETEVEVELLRGDERAVVELGLWLMGEYGLLPLRGSKRGRAMAWRRGVGLPVVTPDLGASLLAERVATVSADVLGRPIVVKLAGPSGSRRPRALATELCQRWPGATLLTSNADVDQLPHPGRASIVIAEGPNILETGHADAAAWVKSGLPSQLIAHLIATARSVGVDGWKILTAFGDYVVPSQRRRLDPAARWADLVVIDEGAPELLACDDRGESRIYAWPSAATLRLAGAKRIGDFASREQRYLPPAGGRGGPVDVTLSDDIATVSFAREAGGMVRAETRPRVSALLTRLGYRLEQTLDIAHRRYVLDGWQVSLDRVAGLGHWCAVEAGATVPPTAELPLAALGLTGARRTTASYLDLALETCDDQDG